MIFVVLGLGGVFFGLGYLITEGNASLLLSGYNTMNSEDQKSFPLKEYLREFKRFHQLFGLGFTSLGLVFYFLDENWLGPPRTHTILFFPPRELRGEYFLWECCPKS